MKAFFLTRNPVYLQTQQLTIRSISHLFHIADIVSAPASNKWKINYVCEKCMQIQENGRIYLIVVDGEIYKIGSSTSNGGIRNTLTSYMNGLGGSPSLRTFGIHMLIQEQLDSGKLIQIYAKFNHPIEIVINGLTSSISKLTYPQIKDMEDLCREDYKKIYNKYPIWNFQENKEQFPQHIQMAHAEHLQKQKMKRVLKPKSDINPLDDK
jgi:hypothetical protein